ncbi:NADH:ubiquinone reductase (Na(+)-transporting) subunit B [Flexibacterium corallicola]|uniref:NADH:ubiquinone reductase (Na(+)-transporting) subunit B n=1 Tax=Flexibacterium corallicola TaxID=3037259 RepID=UPI00286F15AD|nr:NADH:ubiquinone reductase (Na(+)-transporting) subunit B [Pseudovibrio sp. M1P-2-3]
MGLRSKLDSIAPHFEKGGKYEKFYAVYELVDTFLYTPKTVTRAAPHARDNADLKRVMTYVVLATIPAILFGMYNTGYQANSALANMGIADVPGWRAFILSSLGIGFNPANVFANVLHGALYFLPIYVVTLAVGGIFEVIFAAVRGHDVNEGFFVTSMLYTLILPASTPLWQVALGIAFGVVIGKEVFGGTGKNFLNPALVGRAFLYFAYPAAMSGDSIWTPVDGFSGATALGVAASSGVEGLAAQGITWTSSFLGTIQGSFGETSVVAIALGGLFLMVARIANYRLVLGCLIGMIGLSSLFNFIGSDTNPMFALPWYWHLVTGGFMFGLMFMVTEPVTAAMTNKGRWVYGALIGVMCVLIRVVNPAFPEGMMLAILFANIFAPLIDYYVVKANITRREKRHA